LVKSYEGDGGICRRNLLISEKDGGFPLLDERVEYLAFEIDQEFAHRVPGRSRYGEFAPLVNIETKPLR
jgi:hypothetical protein